MYEKSVDYNCIKQICKQKNILFVDYSNDNRFVGKEYLCYDYVHLNEFGAKNFSKILASDIKEFLTNNHINITN
jgi:lysophospholipase L1-like esterase